MKPRSSSTSAPASSGLSNSARTITAVSATGPPTYTGSSSPASQDRSGTASPTVDAAGRLSTRPIAPSSVCSAIRTTVRTKFGSRRTGDARMSLPRSDSAISALCLVAHGLGLLRRGPSLGGRLLARRGGLALGRGGLALLARLGLDRGLLALLGRRGRRAVDAGGADRGARRRGRARAAVLVGRDDGDPQAATEVLAGDDVGRRGRVVDVLPAGG